MSRRANNEGTISKKKRKDGRWVGAVTFPDGKRKWIYGKTRAEVADKLTDVMKDRKDGLPIPAEKQTVAQFLMTWLEDSVKPSVRPRTYESYEGLVRLHIVPYVGKVKLAKLTPQQVQSLLKERLSSGLSPRTVQYIRACLRVALNQALRWGMVSRNVATLVDAPKAKRHEIQPLSPEQAAQLLEAAKGDRLESLFVLALATGMRKGELLGLSWADVDLSCARLAVRRALQRIDGKLTLEEPKTDRSRRTLDLAPFVVEALHQQRSRQLQDKLIAGGRWVESGLVFTTAIGTPLDPRNVGGDFQALLERAGLPRIRFHDLRHSCASLLLSRGLSARVIMDQLGHSQISLTMNTYAHVLPQLRREAADTMQQILGEKAGS